MHTLELLGKQIQTVANMKSSYSYCFKGFQYVKLHFLMHFQNVSCGQHVEITSALEQLFGHVQTQKFLYAFTQSCSLKK